MANVLGLDAGRPADTSPPAIHTLFEILKYCREVLENLKCLSIAALKAR